MFNLFNPKQWDTLTPHLLSWALKNPVYYLFVCLNLFDESTRFAHVCPYTERLATITAQDDSFAVVLIAVFKYFLRK